MNIKPLHDYFKSGIGQDRKEKPPFRQDCTSRWSKKFYKMRRSKQIFKVSLNAFS